MTTPTAPDLVVSTFNIDANDTTPKLSVRRTAIQALVMQPLYQYDGVDGDGNPLNLRDVFNVMAITGCGISAVVASFPTAADASEYIGTDPDGYLAVAS